MLQQIFNMEKIKDFFRLIAIILTIITLLYIALWLFNQWTGYYNNY